jgi:CheY-like chemotaxis protein
MQTLEQESISRSSVKSMNISQTILIAEDQEDAREMMRIFLEGQGYEVVEAANGRDAIDLAKVEDPDLILMDLNMPEVDGLSAVREIRSFERLRNVPVIANSANGNYGMGLFQNIESLGTGYIEYIPKPINFDYLIDLINSLLSKPDTVR